MVIPLFQMKPIIKCEGLGKKYHLGARGNGRADAAKR